jgi:hypothetical protein
MPTYKQKLAQNTQKHRQEKGKMSPSPKLNERIFFSLSNTAIVFPPNAYTLIFGPRTILENEKEKKEKRPQENENPAPLSDFPFPAHKRK